MSRADRVFQTLGFFASLVLFEYFLIKLSLGIETDKRLGIGLLVLLLITSGPYHKRQRERLKHSKQILDNFSPEKNQRPLGL